MLRSQNCGELITRANSGALQPDIDHAAKPSLCKFVPRGQRPCGGDMVKPAAVSIRVKVDAGKLTLDNGLRLFGDSPLERFSPAFWPDCV
jgi:hypothetical protein